MRILIALALLAALAWAQSPCDSCGPCETCVDDTCQLDESLLDACGKCESDCKEVAQNLAITGDGCLVVGGVDILARIRELEQQCGQQRL